MADVRIRPDEGVPERESKAERRLRKEAERLADSRPSKGGNATERSATW
jgi:hypothetical protein